MRAGGSERLGGRLRDEAGQAMVEFAMVVGVLLLIITGIIYFGRFLSYDIDMTHLASAAARYAAVDQYPGGGTPASLSAWDTYFQGQAEGGANVQVWIYPNGTNAGSSATATQPVTACVQTTLHFIPFLRLPDVTLTRSSTMRSEANWTTPDSESVAAAMGCPS